MKKQNCWDFKQCGRGPTGKNDCRAVTDHTFDKVHGGTNAGRACWVVAGTAGDAPASGMFAIGLKSCLRCDFFKAVESEEKNAETGFSATRLGMTKMPLCPESAAQPGGNAPRSSQFDEKLRNEFAEEVNKIMSKKTYPTREVSEEFSREVERLSSKKKEKGH